MALPPGFSTQATVSATQGSQKANISLQDIAGLGGSLPDNLVVSDVSAFDPEANSFYGVVTNVVFVTQSFYDGISPKDESTLYIVTPDPA